MKMIFTKDSRCLVALAFLVFCPLAAPGLTSGTPAAPPAVHWLTPAEEQPLLDLLPPPPQPGSPEDQADVAAVLKAQAARTPGQIAEDKEDRKFSLALYARVLGAGFTPENDPVTYALFRKIDSVAGALHITVKDKWKRLRPFQAHPEVHAVFDAREFSYPSGHSTHAYAYAVILGQLFPDKKEALVARADQIAESRVNAGVHYPSDIAAGKILGEAIAQALLANKAFEAELDQAKAKAEATRK